MLFEIFNIFILVEAFWLVLPAYAANGLVPLFKGKHPIDGGRRLVKNRIFGDGKTHGRPVSSNHIFLLQPCMGTT